MSFLYAGPSYYIGYDYTPTDPLLYRGYPTSTLHCRQWALDNTHCQLEKAWDITQGDTSVVIAVIDRGFRYTHPDLQPQLWINAPEDFNHNGSFEAWRSDSSVPGDLDGDDDDGKGFKDDVIGYDFEGGFSRIDTCGIGSGPCENLLVHGTVVASIAAAANNGIGVVGAAPHSKLMFITAFYDNSDQSQIPNAIAYARIMGADVINMSWYLTKTHDTSLTNPMIRELDLSAQAGIVLVASAGNVDTGGPHFQLPAGLDSVLSVTGVDFNDTFPTWPVGGTKPSYDSTVDLAAPMQHWSAYKPIAVPPVVHWNYAKKSTDPGCPDLPNDNTGAGTSYSAPLVSGVAALVKSAYPNMTSRQIREKIKNSTDPVYIRSQDGPQVFGKIGTGRPNAFKALTFYGNIPGESVNDTTLTGTVYVSGDITVRAGKTLRLAAGTVLRYYPGDVMKTIPDITKTAIVVESGGKLFIDGLPGNPVKLVSFRPESLASTQDWRGIVVKPRAVFACSNAVIRHAYIGIEDLSKYLHTIKNVRIGRCQTYGIYAAKTDSLTIRGCRVDSVNSSSGGTGIDVFSTTGAGVILKRDTIWGCYRGMELDSSSARVESCLVQAVTTGQVPSQTGILVTDQYRPGVVIPDTVKIIATDIKGYYAGEHLKVGDYGRVELTNSNLISDTFRISGILYKSPFIIRNPNQLSPGYHAYLKLRGCKALNWDTAAVTVTQNDTVVINDLGKFPDVGKNIFTTTASGTSWDYIRNANWSGSTDSLKAEGNWFGITVPDTSRFSGPIDYKMSGHISQNTTWGAGNYTIWGDVTLDAGKSWTLTAPTTIYAVANADAESGGGNSNKTELVLKGTLTSLGTLTDSIIFTSAASSPSNGNWGGVLFANPGKGNFGFTRFSYADTALSVRGDSTVRVRNSTFNYFVKTAVFSVNAKTNLGGTPGELPEADCGLNNVWMNTASSGAKAVIKPVGTSGTLLAKGNYWSAAPPQTSWFVGSVDYSSYLSAPATPISCEEGYPKAVAVNHPLTFELSQNYPNPFNPATTIRYALPQAAKVELRIFNILGQVVRKLVDEEKPAGIHQAVWDGKDETGRAVSSGIYLYQIKAGDFIETKKMQLIK